MSLRLFSRRRHEPHFYPGEDIREPGRVQLDGERNRAIEVGRTRLIVTGGLFLIAFVVIGARMVDVTVLKGGEQARKPKVARALGLDMDRGDIVDRNGVLLATSLPTVSLYAHPHEVLDVEDAATKLNRVLPEISRAEIAGRLSPSRTFAYLRRNLTPKQQYEVNSLGIPGLYFERGEKRVYPQGALAAHVVGMTDVDNKGIAGIEKTFDADLKASRTPVRLALDVRVQTILRNELGRAVSDFRAIGATGMVLDAKTGELVAMVSLPDYDPNNVSSATSESMFNRATLGVYEMGSTFKLFNTAVALDNGTANINSTYDASKPIRIARFEINDYHPMNRALSVSEILIHSSNIGSAKMALDVGSEAQKAFLGKVGMLRPASIELPEVGSPLVPSPWRDINTMTISYGHGIAVTPLQMVTGVAALVNGGEFRQATLIRRDSPDENPARQVLKPRTSQHIRELMRMVVADGTGGKADVPGYAVGGKTGTAEKQGVGGYRRKALLSSFIASFPMNDPRYVVLAMIDEPQATKETFGYATGGWTAAPVIGRVVAQMAPMMGIQPVADEQPKTQMVQPAIAGSRSLAAAE